MINLLKKIDPSPTQVLLATDLWGVLPIDPNEICTRLGVVLNEEKLNEISTNIYARKWYTGAVIHKVLNSSWKCNDFVAELLMPRQLVLRYVGLQTSEVARVFGVTPTAAYIRLSSL